MKLKEVGLLHGTSIPFPGTVRTQYFHTDEFDLNDKDNEITIKRKHDGVTRRTDKSNCWWTPLEEAK